MFESCLTEAQTRSLQRWRRRVVRLWIVTMVSAVGVWIIGSASSASTPLQVAAAILLAGFALLAAREMRRGVCPGCGGRIRFEPRTELPPRCPHCGIAFASSCASEPAAH